MYSDKHTGVPGPTFGVFGAWAPDFVFEVGSGVAREGDAGRATEIGDAAVIALFAVAGVEDSVAAVGEGAVGVALGGLSSRVAVLARIYLVVSTGWLVKTRGNAEKEGKG